MFPCDSMHVDEPAEEEFNVVESAGSDRSCSSSEASEEDLADLESTKEFSPPQDDALVTLRAHKESVFAVDMDPTGTYLASGGQDHVAIVWEVHSGNVVFTTEGHDDSVTCVTFNADGTYLATGDMAGGVRVWRRPDHESSWTLVHSDRVGDLMWLHWWCPSNRTSPLNVLAAGDANGLVTIWSIPATHAKHTKYLPAQGVSSICAVYYVPSVDTERPKLVVLYACAELRLWDVKTAQTLASVQLRTPQNASCVQQGSSVFCLACPHAHPKYDARRDREMVAVGGAGGVVYLVVIRQTDPTTDSFVAKIISFFETGDEGSVEALDFSWTQPFFAFGTVNGTIGIVDTVKLRIRQKWTYTDEFSDSVGITGLRWSRSQSVFFTTTTHGAVICWSGLCVTSELDSHGFINPSKPLSIWWGHRSMVLDFLLTPWSASTELSKRFSCFAGSPPTASAVEPFLVTTSDDCTLKVFRVNDSMVSS